MNINKEKRNNLIEMFDILDEALGHIQSLINKKSYDVAIAILSQCQESAVVIGTSIEESCGEGTATVSLLEKLCEDIYVLSQHIDHLFADSNPNPESAPDSATANKLLTIEKSFAASKDSFITEFPVIKEIVFLPCSPSLWSGFDYLYQELSADKRCNVTVIPIPWYDKQPDGSISGESAHYDTDGYPSSVKLTNFNDYDFAAIHPDVIYVQNIFDNNNLGSSVHPFFYTAKLKELCNELVYIPPYIYTEPDTNDEEQVEKLREYLCTPAINNVVRISLQSESMKEALITLLAGNEESKYRSSLSEKIVADRHPRMSEILKLISSVSTSPESDDIADNTNNTTSIVPDSWKPYIYNPAGTRKKIILYSNSVESMLDYSSRLIKKIKSSLEIFKENSDDIALIWRPHPLMSEVADQLRPEIAEEFGNLIQAYSDENFGILDTNPDPSIAIAISDAYYGDIGSVMELFKLTKKPIMVENPDIL